MVTENEKSKKREKEDTKYYGLSYQLPQRKTC